MCVWGVVLLGSIFLLLFIEIWDLEEYGGMGMTRFNVF